MGRNLHWSIILAALFLFLDKSASGWSAGQRDVLNAISKDAAMAVIKTIYQNVTTTSTCKLISRRCEGLFGRLTPNVGWKRTSRWSWGPTPTSRLANTQRPH
jgi:hypothetical protein